MTFILILFVILVRCISATEEISSQNLPIGYCGLDQFDVNNETLRRDGYNPNNDADVVRYQMEKVPLIYRRLLPKRLNSPPGQDDDQLVAQKRRQDFNRYRAISSTVLPVMLRVIYDSSMEAEFPNPELRENFIWSLLYNAHLTLEQPEFYNYVKFSFVVIAIEKIVQDFPVGTDAETMLQQVEKLAPKNNQSDLTLILYYRNVFLESDKRKGTRLLGLASTAVFCNRERLNHSFLINAYGPTNAISLVHEFAHTIGVSHDGNAGGPEMFCPTGKFIMTPTFQAGTATWSSCSVQAALRYLSSPGIYECFVDPKRLARAVPINERFDFHGPGRGPAPGTVLSLDRQCQIATDKVARESSVGLRHEVCQALYCEIDGDNFYIGPALHGSVCKVWGTNETGRCVHTKCVRSAPNPFR